MSFANLCGMILLSYFQTCHVQERLIPFLKNLSHDVVARARMNVCIGSPAAPAVDGAKWIMLPVSKAASYGIPKSWRTQGWKQCPLKGHAKYKPRISHLWRLVRPPLPRPRAIAGSTAKHPPPRRPLALADGPQ